MSYTEDDYLQLSGIQHFSYCRRQWYLIHVLQAWADDERTVSGDLFHRTADDLFKKERRGDVVVSRSIPVSSSSLGVSGRCDVVEFRKDPSGVIVPQIGFKCSITPVEYKVGRKKAGKWDEAQLCAEAICLEETFGTTINSAFLYYGLEKRRTEVMLSDELRAYTRDIAREMHEAYDEKQLINPEYNKDCKKCSLMDLCMPSLTKDVDAYIEANKW
ncbi:MAG: CRISPR-associated protein Cas4 [Candidatus Methanomethylophilaceae archaeon]|nr:CRISPR-associated protein Cas4 [Candidatus Methanomethylophilaceae archaeon]